MNHPIEIVCHRGANAYAPENTYASAQYCIDWGMDYLEIDADDLDEIVIAGAFGSYMRPQHAVGIGMLPNVPLEKIRIAGNAAGTGARLMLKSVPMRRTAEQLARTIEYLELTVYPDFPLFYANGIRA